MKKIGKSHLCEDCIKDINFYPDTKIIKVESRQCDECNIDDMMENFNFEDLENAISNQIKEVK